MSHGIALQLEKLRLPDADVGHDVRPAEAPHVVAHEDVTLVRVFYLLDEACGFSPAVDECIPFFVGPTDDIVEPGNLIGDVEWLASGYVTVAIVDGRQASYVIFQALPFMFLHPQPCIQAADGVQILFGFTQI